MIIPPPPPKLEDYRKGTSLVAGLGTTTIVPDIDFETYSPAGFVWNPEACKFDKLKGATLKGLPAVGAAKYSEHPDAEVICLAYDLKNGQGRKLWKPGDENPTDLFRHLTMGGVIEAWNVAFEYWIWTNICIPKYDFPRIHPVQLRCAAAKSRAHALPGSLDPAGQVMRIVNKKDKDGRRLINKFSIPRNPTKHNASLRTLPSDDPEDAQNFYNYCLKDIQAEAELSSLIPDLSEDEWHFWQTDLQINIRGVAIDLELIEKCKTILEQAYARYDLELFRITSRMVSAASELPALKAWLEYRGYPMPSLTAETLESALKLPMLPPDVRRALQIRDMIGSASVKKLYSMSNQVTRDGRLHDLFMYHAARTGRASGNGPQPQNLPNSGPAVKKCVECDKHFSKDEIYCPWCGAFCIYKPTEWNPKAVADAIEILSMGSLPLVEYYFGDAVEIISGCLRGMFIASPGKDLICSDYSAIEAVVLAALAGEQWRLDVFNTHGKIYEMSAAKINGMDFEEFELYKSTSGSHHPARKFGKVAELACFTHDTQVLTNRGYVSITDVLITDKLWDGIEWVNHQGVINKGIRETITLDGVRMTPNHPINLGDSWKEAKELDLNENILYRALAIGSANLPLLQPELLESSSNARAEHIHILSNSQISDKVKVHDVMYVQNRKLEIASLNTIGSMKVSYLTPSIEDDLLIDYRPQSEDAITPSQNNITAMGVVGFLYAKNGEQIEKNFLNILFKLKDGITQNLKWTGRTLIKGMNPGILGLLLKEKMDLIKERLMTLKKLSKNYETVYDIVNAGPRNRFTIKTNSGHLIVHNSGYQGGKGAWKAFGADEYFPSDDDMQKAIDAWRAASPNIVKFWYGVQCAALDAVHTPGEEFTYKGITYICKRDVLYCRLLSGRLITYHRPIISPGKWGQDALSFEGWNSNPKYGAMGWVRMDTYGGKLTENIVQATARDLLAHAIVNLEAAGYPVVLHVHDEIIVEVPEGWGSVGEVEKIMSTLPAWAKGWPIKASGGWRAKRYNK